MAGLFFGLIVFTAYILVVLPAARRMSFHYRLHVPWLLQITASLVKSSNSAMVMACFPPYIGH